MFCCNNRKNFIEFDQKFICRCQCFPINKNHCGCGLGCGCGHFDDGLRYGNIPYGNTQTGCINGFVSGEEPIRQNGNGQNGQHN